MPHSLVMNEKNRNLKLWQQLNGTAIGRWLHAKVVCWVAPYFGTIKPVFTTLEPGHVEVVIKNRRRVQNHLKSVHAIAMCNAAELVGGVCIDVSLDPKFRWIPVGMTVKYQKMAKTDLTARCQLERVAWEEPGDVVLPVSVFDTNNDEVFHADITMRISEKKRR